MWECIEFYYNEFVMGDVKFMKIHENSLKCICNGKKWWFMKIH
jgi:hypothetical protein